MSHELYAQMRHELQCVFMMPCTCHMHTCSRVHREMRGLEGGAHLYHKMTPPPSFDYFLVVFQGWSQIWPSTKLFRHGIEQSCSAIAMQKLEDKVQQHDEDADSIFEIRAPAASVQPVKTARLAAGARISKIPHPSYMFEIRK